MWFGHETTNHSGMGGNENSRDIGLLTIGVNYISLVPRLLCMCVIIPLLNTCSDNSGREIRNTYPLERLCEVQFSMQYICPWTTLSNKHSTILKSWRLGFGFFLPAKYTSYQRHDMKEVSWFWGCGQFFKAHIGY